MPDRTTPRIPAGMRDILPADMIKRQYVIDTMRDVFERYGFEPLQTSALELTETLMGKYGEEAERLIYKAWYGDTPGGEVALRYDLLVPLCRFVAMNPDLPRPFKRYQIAPVWRADRPQKGRYREFYQCDVDIVGSSSMLADAEVLAVLVEVLNRLGFQQFTVSINDRKILNGIGQYAGVPEALQPGLYRSIDKLDKIGLDGVRRELLSVGLPDDPRQPLQRVARLAIQGKIGLDEIRGQMIDQEGLDSALADSVTDAMRALVQQALDAQVPSGQLQAYTNQLVNDLAPQLRAYYGSRVDIIPAEAVDRLLDLLQISGPNETILDDLAARLKDSPQAMEGITELRDLSGYLDVLGVPESRYTISLAMVRGLDYYTGPIYETTITEPKAMPSITGGGRYDELIGAFVGVSSPATGTSLGLERIIDAMDELGMFPPDLRTTTAEVLVTVFSPETINESLRLAADLRRDGIRTAMIFEAGKRLGDQIGYASSKGIPVVAILGPDEIRAGQVTLRRLGATKDASQQRTVAVADMAATIQNW